MKQKQQNTGIKATDKDFHVKKCTGLRVSVKQQKHKPAKVSSMVVWPGWLGWCDLVGFRVFISL